MVYELIYTEQRKIAWTLILLPIFFTAVFISIAIDLKHLSDWFVITAIALMIICSLVSVLFVIRRWLLIKTKVELTDNYIRFSLQKNSPLYSHKEVTVSWEQLNRFSPEVMNGAFVIIKLSNPRMGFTLSPSSNKENDVKIFGDFLAEANKKIADYNANANKQHSHVISQKSIFESRGARIASVVFLLFLICITLAFLLSGSAGYNLVKIIWLWLAAAVYMIPVFSRWKRKT